MKRYFIKNNQLFILRLIVIMTMGLCIANLSLAKSENDSLSSNTIIIPASNFLEELPKGDVIIDAAALNAPWLFNNTGVVLKSLTNLMTNVTIPTEGTYYIFVRSKGDKGSSFKVAINDKITETVFGNEALTWKRGNAFDLKGGKSSIKITRIHPGSVVDVIVLSKDSSLVESDIISYQLNRDVTLLKEYKIPFSGAVKFGDVNGDARTDFMVLSPDFSAHIYDNNGKELWSWSAPAAYAKERSEFEAPGALWDFDKNGKAEVVHWRMIDGKEYVVIADGETGRILSQTNWPTKSLPHVYNNFRLAIAKLTSATPNEIVVLTDMGETINIDAYKADLTHLWNHTENRKKDNLGHYVYPVDLNNDGIDEVLVGSLLLDSKGRMIWNRFDLLNDNHDHADNYKFADVDKDGNTDIVTANSETGVFIYKALTGQILWQNVAEHSQQIEVGNFLKDREGPQIVVGGRTYGNRQAGEPYLASQLYWFSNKGDKLFKWPGNPINGNPDFVKGDWQGDNKDQLFWFKFKINDKGQGELYFPDPVFHMFDFTGNGAEEVITLSNGILRVYGAQNAHHSHNDKKKDLLYLKNIVVNHTHY